VEISKLMLPNELEKKQIIKARKDGLSYNAIARRFDRSRAYVVRFFSKLGKEEKVRRN